MARACPEHTHEQKLGQGELQRSRDEVREWEAGAI